MIPQVDELRDELSSWGLGVPFAIKRRDPNEPGRKQKEECENKIYALFMRQFRKEKKGIKDMLNAIAPDRKALIGRDPSFYMDYLGDLWIDEAFIASVSLVLADAAQDGILLFEASAGLSMDYTLTNAEAVKWASRYSMDYTLTNAEAVKWASRYSYELIKGINGTTKKALQKLFASFIDTPGMRIGDLVSMLPYTESRALMIATTETTRIYAQAQLLAGEALKKEYPDVRVIKVWWTNYDDRVCPICQPLHGAEVELNELFGGEFEGPPGHVGCRCWMTTTTRIAS